MRKAFMSVCLAALIASTVTAQSNRPAIAGKLEYAAHSLVRLQIVNVPAKVAFLWRVTPGGIDQATTSKEILEFAAPPGLYDVEVILFWTDEKGNPQLDSLRTKIAIWGAPPGPTPPGPTPPGPTPPGPTPPGPTPPGPVDDLTKELKSLYDADTGGNKQKVGKQLAALYRYGAEQSMAKENITAGNLDVVLYKKSLTSVDAGLDAVRESVKRKVQAVLGGNSASTFLDDDKRKALSNLFTRLASAMEEISK